jgi:hypothetical protein
VVIPASNLPAKIQNLMLMTFTATVMALQSRHLFCWLHWAPAGKIRQSCAFESEHVPALFDSARFRTEILHLIYTQPEDLEEENEAGSARVPEDDRKDPAQEPGEMLFDVSDPLCA